jgi:Tle cognate immunity protein 4 C-terminal domain
VKLQRAHQGLAALGVLAVALWLWQRDAQPSSKDLKTMEQHTQNMRTMCVGRFLIDMPGGVQDASGSYGIRIASVEVLKRPQASASELARALDRDLAQGVADLRKQAPTPEGISRFIDLRQVGPFARALHYFDNDAFSPRGKADGYVARDNALFLFKTSAYEEAHVKELTDFLQQVEPTLSARADHEVPTSAGFCIDGGLVGLNPKQGENVNNWGWKLPGHPDVKFSFQSRTNNAKVGPGIVDRQSDITKHLAGMANQIKDLRIRRLDVNGMKAQEWLSAIKDDQPEYQFDLEIPGKPNDNADPFIILSMQVGGRVGGRDPVPPSLTEGEALALWDAVVRSLRLRPGAL